jgi:hypothetical protein
MCHCLLSCRSCRLFLSCHSESLDAFVSVVLERDWIGKEALLDFLDRDMTLPLGFCCDLGGLLRFRSAGLHWEADKVSLRMAKIDL